MALFVIEGCGDIGSAIAHQLFTASHSVLVTDLTRPAHLRRGMSFVDAFYQSSPQLEGVTARYFEPLPNVLPNEVIICPIGLEQILDQFDVKAVINARMQKRDIPLLPNWKSKHDSLLIGLGPGFLPMINCDVAIETSWGKDLGVEVMGATKALEGDPRPIEGLARERIVYAKNTGQWRTTFDLAQKVQAGDVIGTISDEIVRAPISGLLRGISHHLAEVKVGQKVIEIDPSCKAQIYGLGERPLKIAKGVIQALQKRMLI